jgi:hypothetical protein
LVGRDAELAFVGGPLAERSTGGVVRWTESRLLDMASIGPWEILLDGRHPS